MCKPLTPWERCLQFHGHECGGLIIGYKAATYAKELLNISFSDNENVVCISENDACDVDAIQIVLGCSVGKGNLFFHITGKQAFSFYDRAHGKSVRLVLKPQPEGMSCENSFNAMLDAEPEQLFDVMDTTLTLPESARIFGSHKCANCGETAGDNWLKVVGDKYYCLDCYKSYDRFNV